MQTIAVFNFKGGTGKSATTQNISAAIAGLVKGKKVLMIDLDGQRTLSASAANDGAVPTVSEWLDNSRISPVKLTESLYLLPGDRQMFLKESSLDLFTPALKRIKDLGFDFVVMDCPPSLGFASVQAIMAADCLIMPTLSEPASLRGLAEAIQMIREDEQMIREDGQSQPAKPVHVLRTRYRTRLRLTRECDLLLTDGASDLNFNLLTTVIPENVQVAEAFGNNQSVIQYAPNSVGAIAYVKAAEELIKTWS